MHNPYPTGFTQVTIPECQSGTYIIKRKTLSREDVMLCNLRLIRDGQKHRVIPPNTYTMLYGNKGEQLIMSDTPAEAREHHAFYEAAEGNVLISGLGLGFVLQAIINKNCVNNITVVEKSSGIIKMVGQHYIDMALSQNKKLEIINDDIFKWSTKSMYDVIWHDIWPDICLDNKKSMKVLKNKFKKLCKWQSCWSEEYLTNRKFRSYFG